MQTGRSSAVTSCGWALVGVTAFALVGSAVVQLNNSEQAERPFPSK